MTVLGPWVIEVRHVQPNDCKLQLERVHLLRKLRVLSRSVSPSPRHDGSRSEPLLGAERVRESFVMDGVLNQAEHPWWYLF